jgi:cytochrome P450
LLTRRSILGNIYKVAFWAIAYISYDPQLLADIRTEIMPALKNGKLNELYLAKHCPRLEALISEILRLTVASALVREIVAPTTLGGKVLQPGSKLLVSSEHRHII